MNLSSVYGKIMVYSYCGTRLASTASRGRSSNMAWYVYVLSSKIARKSYTGSADNLSRRLKEHNEGKSYYTKRYKPWELIYTEEYLTEHEARMREKYLKSASGRKKVIKELFTD